MIIALAIVIMVGRLWYLQILQGDYYARLADGNRMRQIRVTPARGIIYDRQQQPLVRTRGAFTVSLVPEGVPKNSDALELLGDILGMSVEELNEAIERGRGLPYEPVRIARDVDASTVIAIEENRRRLPGVFIQEEPVREYLSGDLASHVLGYIGAISREELQSFGTTYRGSDWVGKSGIERLFESQLRGYDGTLTVEVNALSRPVQTVGSIDPIPGRNLVLSIDAELQEVAQRAFAEHVSTLQEDFPEAKNGAVVALDPRTGEILAMVSVPGYEPERLINSTERSNYYQRLIRDPNLPFYNRVTQGQYGPGSAFKPFVAVAMLEEGVVRPGDVFNATGTSRYGVRDWVITRGLAPFGRINLTEALAMSSNHYFAENGAAVGIDRLAPWIREFGFGERTNVELSPTESRGTVPDREWKRERFADQPRSEQVWYPSDTEQVSIGQGFINVTPLQLALAYSGIANRGVIYEPILVKSILEPDGTVVEEREPKIARELNVKPETWNAVIEGMKAVITHPRGTARSAFSGFPISVAGKTGSYEIRGRETNGVFGAFAPAEDPELVVIAIVEQGGGGGGAAAPIARQVFDAYFSLENRQ